LAGVEGSIAKGSQAKISAGKSLSRLLFRLGQTSQRYVCGKSAAMTSLVGIGTRGRTDPKIKAGDSVRLLEKREGDLRRPSKPALLIKVTHVRDRFHRAAARIARHFLFANAPHRLCWAFFSSTFSVLLENTFELRQPLGYLVCQCGLFLVCGAVPNMSTQNRDSDGRGASSTPASLRSLADEQALSLTTIGRKTGLPREIEIWFVVCCERFYLFAETGEAARVGQEHRTQSQGPCPHQRPAN
jgi:hypothetical protein